MCASVASISIHVRAVSIMRYRVHCTQIVEIQTGMLLQVITMHACTLLILRGLMERYPASGNRVYHDAEDLITSVNINFIPCYIISEVYVLCTKAK